MGRIAVSLGLIAAMSATAVPPRAEAFCGFYVSGSSEQLFNNATRVAMMRWGTRTVLSMSNDYQGPPQDFAMVVPVPIVLQQENVKTLPLDVFSHLETLTAPRLVEYWERDPCAPPERYFDEEDGDQLRSSVGSNRMEREQAELGVRIEARFSVGEYNVLVLSATQSSGLETWLHQNNYNIPQGSAEALAPYVREQSKFFVAKIDITKVQKKPDGTARLSPLRFHYDSPDLRLPVRLGLLNAGGAQDLIVYLLHPTSRFETANYKNVFVPTNLDVTDETKSRFGEFYSTLFEAAMQSAGGRAVVTEYAWSVGGCDPCPGPPMADGEMAVLGGDVIYQNNPEPQTYHGRSFDYVVTRLHTRYNRNTLTEDLVFREAPPALGGREFMTDANGGIEQGVKIDVNSEQGGYNFFQARYAIRHRWTGPVTCNAPKRGVWEGPPGGTPSAPMAAGDIQAAPRTKINLPAMVLTPVPGVDLSARLPTPASTVGSAEHLPTAPRPTPRGCACETAGSTSHTARWSWLPLGALLALFARRKRERHSDPLSASNR